MRGIKRMGHAIVDPSRRVSSPPRYRTLLDDRNFPTLSLLPLAAMRLFCADTELGKTRRTIAKAIVTNSWISTAVETQRRLP